MKTQHVFSVRRFLFLFFTLHIIVAQENNPSVFHANRGGERQWFLYENNHEALYKIITNEAFELLDQRKKKVENLRSADDWRNYQKELKQKVFTSLNNFEKTPLNVQVTGKIKKESFTVEKIMFESHPDFFVTGCLFIPKKRQKPAPAIIYCSGHNDIAFRNETYQRVILNLVEKGFIVFGMDPIGQGERLHSERTDGRDS